MCPWWSILFSALTVIVFIDAQQTGYAGESSAEPDKMAIIRLIEDRLSTAYTIRSEKDAPDFGTLDQIYPKWHKGEPAKARRHWTFHDYRYYIVSYLVHSVWIERPGMATVKGKKRVHSSQRKKFLKFFRRTKKVTLESQFTIACRRNSAGLWEIRKEMEYQ